MIQTISKAKVEYGDFQTPLELTEQVCQKLLAIGIIPDIIIEPTCGIGNFIEASSRLFKLTKKIVGVDINQQYLEESIAKKEFFQFVKLLSLEKY